METKTTYKDSLFRAIFNDRDRLARLYKALSGNEVSPEEIDINTLSGVFMNDIKNDISFCVGNRLIILLEHQSTWNPNMPLRFLWYLSNLYRDQSETDIIYKGKLHKIPAPEFYVLYNGTQNIPYFQQLKLSEAFYAPSSALELTASCYNINYAASKEILERCHDLLAYSVFIAKVREYLKANFSRFDAVRKAIRYCESHDLMADYFKKHESEVFDMVSFEWNATRAKEVAHEEGVEDGIEIGLAKGLAKGREEGIEIGREQEREEATKRVTNQVALSLLQNKIPLKLISESTHLPIEEVEQLAKEHQIAI